MRRTQQNRSELSGHMQFPVHLAARHSQKEMFYCKSTAGKPLSFCFGRQ